MSFWEQKTKEDDKVIFKKNKQKWNEKYLNLLQEKKEAASKGGGEKRIDKQHNAGKLTARERLEILFDDNAFVELDVYMESKCTDFSMQSKKAPGDGVITGYGYINGRLAFASSEDFTVIGGTLGEFHAKKICRALDEAFKMKVPFIFINDSGGARIEEGIDSLAGYSGIFYRNTIYSGIIPQIAAILGPCAGGACYSPAICDYIFMTERNSRMFITGPDVVKEVIGESVSADELGGAAVHRTKTGVVDFVYPDDKEALMGIRRLLTYLPQNNEEHPPKIHTGTVDRSSELQSLVPDIQKKIYDVKKVIDTFADAGSFLEVKRDYASNIVVGFARLDGEVVGIVANQPQVMGGALDSNASEKAARFIRNCDCFSIPLITLVDVPGFFPGREQENGGIIRRGAKLLFAFSEATIPKITLIMRKAYGGAYIAMNSKGMGADIVYAWPIAQMAVMGAQGAVNIIFRKQIANSPEPEKEQDLRIREYEEKFMNPYIAASRGYIDEIIFPEETRNKISCSLKMLKTKSSSLPGKKHGNIPL